MAQYLGLHAPFAEEVKVRTESACVAITPA